MANTPQNPLSYVAPGVSAGAATVLPSKPFDPQAFFADLMATKKAEAQLKLKEVQDIQEDNAKWLERTFKYKDNYWREKDAEKIETKASETLENLYEIYDRANFEGRKVSGSDLIKAKQMMVELNNDIVASRKRQQEVEYIQKKAQGTSGVMYAPEGIAKMWEDVDNDTFSIEKMGDYLIPYKKYEDTDISNEISKLLSTHTTTQGNRDLTEVSKESIDAVMNLMTATNSTMNQHLNNLVKAGVIENTPEARNKKFQEIFNTGVQSINTANKARTTININMGGTTPSAPSKGGWVDEKGVVKFVPKTSTSGVIYDIPSASILPVASRFTEPILIDQGKFEIQDVAILPVAIDNISWTDVSGKVWTVKKDAVITKAQIDSMKSMGDNFMDTMNSDIVFAAYLTGRSDKKEAVRKFDETVHGWIKEQSKKQKGVNFWTDEDRKNVYDKVKAINANKANYF